MAGRLDRPAATAAVIYLGLCFLTLIRLSAALQSVAGSPCESVCAGAGTLEEDVVCLDGDYQSTVQGREFESCVTCQLNSTAVDTATNETDVEWGLLNLRFTLSSCMFGFPEEHVSISSPCQVSCQPLNSSISFGISNDSSSFSPQLGFCNVGIFTDTTINNCAFCYSLIPEQIFTANFLQALHIACRQAPIAGKSFYPEGASIFNATLIAGPAPASNNGPSHSGLRGWKLGLAIALPIVGGILLIGASCWSCFLFTRRRRRQMAQTGRMNRVHNAFADGVLTYSPVSAKMAHWSQVEPAREMAAISPSLPHAKERSPGLAQGRWSHATGASGKGDDQRTPLRSSFQRDEVGPGTGQIRDPNLHEQYFGVGDDEEEMTTAAASRGLGLYDGGAEMAHARTGGDEKGHFM